ncbi:hypothetical protein L195_g042440 [Trifolium pratense]|uniref:Uncharacterized protein n=1 Tax=Trifolium pratense TaxID=57577 RepID=A0A2K3M6E0_TRIPR|nr:hypothetical protein L195_g042440 [Trifolium pratense]
MVVEVFCGGGSRFGSGGGDGYAIVFRGGGATFFRCSWFAGVFLFAGVYGDPTFADGFEGARDGSMSVVVVTVLCWDGGGCVRSVKGWCGGGCDSPELEVLQGCSGEV